MRYKKIIATVMLLLMTAILVSCASSPESVRLASKSSILTYVKHEYGEAEFISKENGEHKITYMLKDKQYGFTYEITSYAQSVGMDGSTFWYSESKSSNFDTKYQEYILSNVKSYIEQKVQETNTIFKEGISPDLFFAEIQLTNNSDTYNAIDFLKELGQKISEIDDRKYFSSSEISLVNKNRYDNEKEFYHGRSFCLHRYHCAGAGYQDRGTER